jgi:hypothetical protein
MRIEIHLCATGYEVRVLAKTPWVYAECPTYEEAKDWAHRYASRAGGQVFSMLPVVGTHIKTQQLETLA